MLRNKTAVRLEDVGVLRDAHRVGVDKLCCVEGFIISRYSRLLSIASILETLGVLTLEQVLPE